MKELPQHIHAQVNNSLAIIKRKSPEKKMLLLGLILCAFVLLLLYLLTRETASISASIKRASHVVHSPVAGAVVELPFAEGSMVKRGDALLRFDPAHIRKQNIMIREYLTIFQQNRHNTGTLKQKFRPLFDHIFGELGVQYQIFAEKEANAIKHYKTASIAHSKIKLQMRNPQNRDENGLPNKALVEKEKQTALEVATIGAELEKASLERAEVDKKIRLVTDDLNKPHGILYRYLEEQNEEVQKLVRNEYLYAEKLAVMGKIFVKTGEQVEKNTPLYEVLPEDSGDWWVDAIFTPEDAEQLKERDLCTVVTEDGFELDARITQISPKKDNVEVRLFMQNAPKELSPSKFVKVIKK